MKKNRFMKIAAVVFTLCLITTCGISTTLAKYTTSSSASDTARVAKWGVEVSTSGTMFGKAYGANTAGAKADRIIEASTSVNTSNSNKIVAPGTMNDAGIQIKIKGQPEVAFGISASGTVESEIWLAMGIYGVMVDAHGINAASDLSDIYTYDSAAEKYTKATAFVSGTKYYKLTNRVDVARKYNPIVWTGKVIANGTKEIGNGTNTFSTLQEAVNALTTNGINKVGAFKANENVDLTYILTWSWAYENNQELAYADGADTILGDLQANRKVVKLSGNEAVALENGTDYSLVVKCNITVGATQID